MTPREIRQKEAERVSAVVPLNAVAVQDVGRAAQAVDQWLRDISNEHVSLATVKNVAGALPVVGNIMAVVDALGDIVALVRDRDADEAERFFNWVSLGINLIGIIPLPPSMAAARMSLRPTLHLVRQELKHNARGLSDAVVALLVDHLNARIAGELDKYIDEASAKLADVLGECADKGKTLVDGWSAGLRRLAAGEVFKAGPPAERPRHDPHARYTNVFAAAWGALKASGKKAVNRAAGAAVHLTGADKLLLTNADLLAALGRQIHDRLKAQANADAQRSIAWLLKRLKQAVVQYLDRHKHRARPVVNHATVAKSGKRRPEGTLEAVGHQAPVQGDGDCCKGTGNGRAPAAAGRSPRSLSYATGSETVVHTDFTLPGHMPIAWSRTYYSRLGAFDHPQHAPSKSATPAYLGARWVTPYTTRIEQAADGSLRYLAADGRAHAFPKLAAPGEDGQGDIGQTHHDAIEDLTLGRGNDALLVLSHGRDFVETFELAPQFLRQGRARTRGRAVYYRLASQRTQAGHVTELAYRHEGGQLSDITSGDRHVGTRLDAQGRIQSLWLMQDGQATRQLAGYTYADQPDGSSDLVAAEDEDGHRWAYAYLATAAQPATPSAPGAPSAPSAPSTHLLRRYTDRTGRGIHLHWMHGDGFDHAITAANSARAKAWREHADDGSFDTTVVWNRHIRLTTVIDALGQQTEYYFDIHGYVYRIVYPEVEGEDDLYYRQQEWFFRDAQANITGHLHADGSRDDYAYDGRGNLVRHERPDGSVVHFAYDDADNLTGIRDGEGHAWLRNHEGNNLVEEIDPLGHTTRYDYDSHGLPVEVTDAHGGKKQLAYDGAGQLVRYTDCSGKTSSWAYDERGRLVQARNAAGETTRYVYERGQLAQVVLPDGSREHYEHDAEGRLLLHRDALQRETRYAYGRAGLITQRIDAAGHTLGYAWDRLGRLSALTNENNRTHSMRYDPLGRLLAEEHFDKASTRYGYHGASGVLWWVREADALTELSFDAMGRLLERRASLRARPVDPSTGQPPPGAREERVTGSTRVSRYAYDGNGRLIDARNDNMHLQWYLDPVGRVHTEHHHYLIGDHGQPLDAPTTAVWKHRHDALGQRVATTRPDGHSLSWLRYGSGHVHGLMLDELEVLQIERDELHRQTRRVQANGLAEQREYDPGGRLKAQVLSRAERLAQHPDSLQGLALAAQAQAGNQVPPRAMNLRRLYSYDPAGQLRAIQDSLRGSTQYAYDPVGRLLSATGRRGPEVFAFDPAGNMLDLPPQAEGTAAPPSARRLPPILDNLLKDYAGTHYEWDARGNLLHRVHNGQLHTFTWNASNELEAVTHNRRTRTRYWYDPLGRRIAKHTEAVDWRYTHDPVRLRRLQAQRAKEEGLGTVLYGWDGDQLAWETDFVRRQTVHYVHEPDGFVPILQAVSAIPDSMLRRPGDPATAYEGPEGYDMDRDPLHNGSWQPGLDRNGEIKTPLQQLYFYQCDHLGTPQELTDEHGEIAWEAHYKAWGEARLTISEAARKAKLVNPIRFQGQYFDEESGLHYNRFRYYDPHAGRFISKDPIGLLGGFNTHTYAPNPTQWIDPLGLAPKKSTSKTKVCSVCDPCEDRDPAKSARAWQGNYPYSGVDSYKNTVVRKGTVLYTLYPHGSAPGNHFVQSDDVIASKTARQYNDSAQVAHKGNWSSPSARDMRDQLHAYVVKKDTCMAVGTAQANPHLGGGGAKQFFIENRDKPNLIDTGRIIAYSK